MNTNVVATAFDDSKFDVRATWPDAGPQIIAIEQVEVRGGVERALGFRLMLDPAGVEVHAPSGSVGFQMRVEFQSQGKRRLATDGVTFYQGDVVPLWLELRTEIPAEVQFDDVAIELWLSE